MTATTPPMPARSAPSDPLAGLTAQVQATVEELHPRTYPVSVRVRLAGTGPALAACEIWAADTTLRWTHRADVPAGIGATMLDLERSLVAAGYIYGLTHAARPAWRFDANGSVYTLDITQP